MNANEPGTKFFTKRELTSEELEAVSGSGGIFHVLIKIVTVAATALYSGALGGANNNEVVPPEQQ